MYFSGAPNENELGWGFTSDTKIQFIVLPLAAKRSLHIKIHKKARRT